VSLPQKAARWDEATREKVRDAIRLLELGGVEPSVRKIQKQAAPISRGACQDLWQLVREGVLPRNRPWTAAGLAEHFAPVAPAPPPEPARGAPDQVLVDAELAQLLDLVDNAEDPLTLAEASKQVVRLLATRQVDHNVAGKLTSAIREARMCLRQHHQQQPPERDERSVLAVTPEGAELVRAFEGIASDARRLEVLEYVADVAEEDLAGEVPVVIQSEEPDGEG